MIELQVNGEPQQLPAGATLTVLLEDMSLTGKRIAVEVNQAIIPRSQHDLFILSPGDQVEIVQAIGGG